jgi:ABC-type transport system involved in multi-copper enzyme maturation permease subunit
MLWHKSWLETRWRFLIGLAVLMVSAAGAVLYYPEVMKLMPLARAVDATGEIGRRIRESADLARDYRGYVWSQWIRQSLTQLATLFAALLGTGGALSQASSGAALFTLSLPASRTQVLGIRAATGLAEFLVLAFVPPLLVTLLSPAVGQSYGVGDAVIHGASLFVAGSVFFSLAFLLSTVFSDVWRPLLIACSIAVVLAFCEEAISGLSRYSVVGVMSGETYFRTGELPWAGLLISAALSVALLFGAFTNMTRRDF